MTVETLTSRVTYTGAGTTGPFTIPFYFLEEDDLIVTKITIATGAESVLVLDTDYTITGEADEAGGELTLTASLSSSFQLEIWRYPDLLQQTDYPPSDPFPAESHERALDKIHMILMAFQDEFEDIDSRLDDIEDRLALLEAGGGGGDTITLNNLTINELLTVLGDLITDTLTVNNNATINNLTVTGTFDPPDGFLLIKHLSEEVLNLILTSGGGGGGAGLISSGNGRLTLESGTPIMTTDVAGATTVYYAGSVVLILNDGTGSFAPQTITELRQTLADDTRSPAASAASKTYDLFGWIGASQAVTSITRSGAVATVTKVSHGYVAGDVVFIAGAGETEYNGAFEVATAPDANTFTFAVTGAPATPATGTITMKGVFLSRGPAWRNGGQAITGATNATPIVITAVAHGLSNGDIVTVSGVGVNTAANGVFTVANKADDTFELAGSVGNGVYATGTGAFAARGVGAATSEIELIGNTYVNTNAITNGPAANMGTYLGTIRTNASNQVDWKLGSSAAGGGEAVLGVWNVSNRVRVGSIVQDSTASWTYNSLTARKLDNSATNRISLVRGLNEDAASIKLRSQVDPNNGDGGVVFLAMDSITAQLPGSFGGATSKGGAGVRVNVIAQAEFIGYPGLGFHFFQGMEVMAGGTSVEVTFFGASTGYTAQTLYFTGLIGDFIM